MPLIIIPILALLGLALYEDQKEEQEKTPAKKIQRGTVYGIYLETEEFGKCNLIFDSFRETSDFYDKLLKRKSITYGAILQFDEDQRKTLKKHLDQGGTQGDSNDQYPSDKASDSIQYMKLYVSINGVGADLKAHNFEE